MKHAALSLAAGLLLSFPLTVTATTLYVDVSNPAPASPYTNWVTAATNIQDAVDAAVDGDAVLVTNGVYNSGGRVVYGAQTNRVAVNKALTVQSVNGPDVTLICGNNQDYAGYYSVRCVYMTNRAVLSGFTLTNGCTGHLGASTPELNGGGLWCESVTALISNCVIKNSMAWNAGGGACSGTLTNCIVAGNSANGGGGAINGTLNNCSLVGNWAGSSGGGAFNATLNNCSLTNNRSSVGGAAAYSWLSGCTVVGNECFWSTEGEGGGVAFCTLNSCTLMGNAAPFGKGGGAYGGYLEACTLSSNSAGAFGGGAYGGTLTNCTIIGNGATNDWPNGSGQGGGVYQAALNNCALMGNYAAQGGGAANSSLTNCVVSTNSASSFGGGAYGGFLEGCVVSTNSARMGGGVAGGTLVDCTLAGNSARENDSYGGEGGGAYGCPPGAECNFPDCTLINCTLIGNQATAHEGTGWGGGAWGATLTNCLVFGNYAGDGGGGAEQSTLIDCTLASNRGGYGAGAENSTLTRCTFLSNSGSGGGGVYGSTLDNCALIGNSAYIGGGASETTLNNCTLVGNYAYYGGGAAGGTLNNCIVYANTAAEEANGPNWYYSRYPLNGPANLNYCCTTPLPTNGVGNFTNEPILLDMAGGDFRLQADSPCINAGRNAYLSGATDLDGNPRIKGETVDIGAYEFQSPTSIISYAWLKSHGLPTDGSVDWLDSDNDGMNNWQEWVAGTNPTDAASVLRLQRPLFVPGSVTLTWSSATNRAYFVERGTDLALPPAFSMLQTNIPGVLDTTSFTDTNPPVSGPSFYRVGVQP